MPVFAVPMLSLMLSTMRIRQSGSQCRQSWLFRVLSCRPAILSKSACLGLPFSVPQSSPGLRSRHLVHSCAPCLPVRRMIVCIGELLSVRCTVAESMFCATTHGVWPRICAFSAKTVQYGIAASHFSHFFHAKQACPEIGNHRIFNLRAFVARTFVTCLSV